MHSPAARDGQDGLSGTRDLDILVEVSPGHCRDGRFGAEGGQLGRDCRSRASTMAGQSHGCGGTLAEGEV